MNSYGGRFSELIVRDWAGEEGNDLVHFEEYLFNFCIGFRECSALCDDLLAKVPDMNDQQGRCGLDGTGSTCKPNRRCSAW
jgi:hypothetical protein